MIEELFGVYEKSARPWTAMDIAEIPYPSTSLTLDEKSTRKIIVKNLENITSVQSINSEY